MNTPGFQPILLAIFAFSSTLQTARSQSLLNLDCGVGSRSAKTGFAATGQSTNDYWNLYRHYDPKFAPGMPLIADGKLDKLRFADGSESKASVAVSNAPGVWGNATGDPMFDTYLFAQNGSNIVVTLTGLDPGRYHFYLYGHADPDVTGEQNSVFTLRSGTNVFGPALTLGGAGWKATQPWQERYQYVVFRDVPVLAGKPVVIDVAPGANGVAVLNGLQISSRGTSPPKLFVAAPPKVPAMLTNILFHEVRYEGKVSDTEARFNVDLHVESMTTNEISAPLFEGDVAVIAPDLPAGLRIASTAKKYRLIATAPGAHRVRLELLAKITKAEPWNQIGFTGPDAAIASVNAQASAPGIEMQLLRGAQIEPDQKATSKLAGFLGSDRQLSLRWQSKAVEVKRTSLVTVETLASAQITPTVIKFNTRFAYEILQAPVPRLTLALPKAQALTKLQGEQIRDWSVKPDGDRQLLTVEFIKAIEKSYSLTLLTEQPVEATPLTAQLEPPQPLDVERESGSFSLSADDVAVEVDSAAGLRQVNAASGALAAYRFFGRPVTLAARLKRIEPVVKAADRVTARLEETRLLITHALSLGVEKAGIYGLELAPQAGFTVADVKGEGVEDWKVTDGPVADGKVLRVNFNSRVLGARKIEVQLEQPLKEFPSQFTVLPARLTGATNETAQIGVAAALGIRLKTAGELTGLREIPVSALQRAAGILPADSSNPAGGTPAARSDEQLAYSADQGGWRLTIAAERLPARIVADVFDLVTVGDGLVGGSATIRYGLINQGVQEFRIKLPTFWKNVEFTGPNIRRKESGREPSAAAGAVVPRPSTLDTNYVTWVITLQDKAWGGYTLVITYDYQFDPKRAVLNLAGAHGVGVERETGSVALTAAANLKLEPQPAADPLYLIDPSELSEADRALITRPVLLAWRYAGDTFQLAAATARFDELPVLDAVADRTQLTSVLTEEGQRLTQASFMVKNNDRQFQRFLLPKDAQFWGCYVNTRPAKAETDGAWLLVSLPRGANRDEAFAVDLVYAQTFDPLRARLWPQTLRLAAPTTDVPNTYAEWQVFVPSSQKASRFGGNMTVARGTVYGLREAWQRFTEFYGEFFRDHGVALVVWGGIVILLIALIGGAIRRGAKGVLNAMVVLAILVILASMALPSLSKAKRRSTRASATSNLKQIALAAQMWAADNNGNLPLNLEQMKDQLGSDKVLRDPESGEPFVYVGAGKREDTPHAIIAYSPVDLNGRAVALADGSVQHLTSAQFNQALQRDALAASQFAAAGAQREAVARQQLLESAAPAAPPPAHAPAMPAQQPAGPAVVAPGAAPLAAGLRSLRIEIPRSGQQVSFTKVLNVGDEPLSVTMSVMKNSWYERRRAALQLVTFLAGLAMAWIEWRRQPGRSLRLAVGLALALGSVTSLALTQRTLHLVLIAGVPALALWLVASLAWRFRPRKRPAPAPDAPLGTRKPEAGTAAAGTAAALALACFVGRPHAAFAAEEGTHIPNLQSPISNSWTVVSAFYTGTVAEKVARFDAALAVATFSTNQVVPLFGEDVAIEQFATKAANARLLRQGNTVALRLDDATNATVHMKLVVKLGGDASKRQLNFGIPPALSSKLVMALGEAEAEVEFPTAVAFQRETAGAQTRVEAVLGSGDRVEMTWTPRMKRATEMAASVFVDNTAVITVGGGAVNTRATLAYQITQGELRQLKVRLPAGERLLRVEGELIRTWELRDDAGAQTLLVDLVKGVSPSYRLTVETERVLEKLPVPVKVAVPSPQDVIRETGLVGVRGTEELSLTVESVADLQRVDLAEFAKASATPGEGLVSAYRFLKPAFQLTVRAEAVQPQTEAVARNSFTIGFDEVSLRAQVDYTIKQAGVFALRLTLPAGFKVDSVVAADVSPQLEPAQQRSAADSRRQPRELQWSEQGDPRVLEVALKQRTLGAFTLTIGLSRAQRELPRTLDLAGVRPLDVQKLAGFVSVSAEPGVAVKTTAFDGLTEIPAATLGFANPGGRSSSVLAYKFSGTDPQAAPWRLNLGTEIVESWVRTEVADVVSVTETLVSGRAVVRYDIANAPVKEFRLRVPVAYTNVEVLGPNIRRRDRTNDVWTVELQSKVRGVLTFTVTWEQPRNAKTNGELAVAGIEALDVERETGFVVLLAKPPLQVSERSATDPLIRIDARELPDWAGVSAGASASGGEVPVLVYRYLRPSWGLRVEARRFQEAAVLQALVDNARFTTVVADDGQMMTEMALSIRNNGRQHLEVELPSGTNVWSVLVAGQPVRPTTRAGKLLLPLERSATGDTPVSVELTYVGSGRFPKTKGTVNLVSPKFDVPLKNARWELYLPPDYDYTKFEGSMTHEATAAPVVQVFSSSEYYKQEQSRNQAQASQVRSFLSRSRKGLAEGNLKDANVDLQQALVLNSAVADVDTQRELEGLKKDLGKVQGSNLIRAQRAYTADNTFRFNNAQVAQQPAQPGEVAQQGQQAAEMVQYDADAAEQQVKALNRAQEVAGAKVQPLRVNLPTRGLRHNFTQVLQTEVNKPMTIQFTAKNTKEIGWFRRFCYGGAGFVLLWIFTAVVAGRASRPREVSAASG